MPAIKPKVTPGRLPLSAVLPPLVLGTATFNTQYVDNPSQMPYTSIVSRALDLGINAFDTSPYYGPSEHLLGDALHSLTLPNPANSETKAGSPHTQTHTRDSYLILTKAGRISGDCFDYSPAWIRYSVLRSLRRLHTPYLDLVYCHDVEFVSPAQVLAAVRELRRLRDEDGLVRYVGISGYPVDVLCSLAEMVHRETGEGLDAVMSYCHCTVQNQQLIQGYLDDDDTEVPDAASANGTAATSSSSSSSSPPPLARLREASVSVVLNASMLGMGLLTTCGVDHGPQAKWHPSPPPLRQACAAMATAATASGERLERVSIRWALDAFARAGAKAGVGVNRERNDRLGDSNAVGASVMGVTSLSELNETWGVWRSVLAGSTPRISINAPHVAAAGAPDVVTSGDGLDLQAASLRRYDQTRKLVRKTLWPVLGGWRNYSWKSGGLEFVNKRKPGEMGVVPDDDIIAQYESSPKKVVV